MALTLFSSQQETYHSARWVQKDASVHEEGFRFPWRAFSEWDEVIRDVEIRGPRIGCFNSLGLFYLFLMSFIPSFDRAK